MTRVCGTEIKNSLKIRYLGELEFILKKITTFLIYLNPISLILHLRGKTSSFGGTNDSVD